MFSSNKQVAVISPWKILNSLTQRCFVPSLKDIGQVVLEKIFKCLQCIFAIWFHLPSEKSVALHLNKLESPSHKDVDRQTDDGQQAIRFSTGLLLSIRIPFTSECCLSRSIETRPLQTREKNVMRCYSFNIIPLGVD